VPGTLRFQWNGDAQYERVVTAAVGTAERLGVDATQWWEASAPVGDDPRTSGELKREWFTDIEGHETSVVLTFGSRSRHAIFVELGTGKMTPRAPIRQVAGEIWPMIPYYFADELTR